MRNKAIGYALCALSIVLIVLGGCSNSKAKTPQPFRADNIVVGGDLKARIVGNMDRIEQSMFWPSNLFASSDSSEWPGDLEGRTLLAWVLDGQIIKRNPIYAEPLVSRLSERINKQGYIGPVYSGGVMNEQQIAGNSWMLRGLCAYYEWTPLEESRALAEKHIRSIVEGLFLAHKGAFQTYPVARTQRDSLPCPETGTIVKTENHWMLSSDEGSVFVALDGLSHAYAVLRDPEIKEVFGELATRFLAMDVLKEQAHTHSVLSAMRGILRYTSVTGDRQYLDAVAHLWAKVWQNGLSEYYGVYHQLGRYDTWTDPNAVTDACLVATELWTLTRRVSYLEDAELIYLNAFSRAQRSTGGFGSDTNPNAQDAFARMLSLELPHTGTLRGAEGLAGAALNGYCAKADTLFVLSLGTLDVSFSLGGEVVKVSQVSDYPLVPESVFNVSGGGDKTFVLLLPARPWNASYKVTKNGILTEAPVRNGFYEISGLKGGDRVDFSFSRTVGLKEPLNVQRALPGQFRVMYGSMIICFNLGVELNLTRQSKIIPTSPGFFDIEGTLLEMIPRYTTFSTLSDIYYPPQKILF